MTVLCNQQTVARFRRSLLGWYDRCARSLPWRIPPGMGSGAVRPMPDPYHILVSEAMLQQTQVSTVLSYFARFMERFPTVEALAAADEQEVLAHWQGLGYYRRAQNLHKAARLIVMQHEGWIPDTAEGLLALPGVGQYTAGAIASIAFGRREAILDGNVARVLARFFAIAEPIGATATRHHLWTLADRLTSPTRPGDFNQAMMDLGATVCTPRQPQCQACPLVRHCLAHQYRITDQLPRKNAKAEPKHVQHTILAIERNGRFLFEQRPSQGLWAKMWQLATIESPRVEIPPAQWIADRYRLIVSKPESRAQFKHQTTHRTITFNLLHTCVRGGRLRPGTGIWRPLTHYADLPLSRPQHKAIQLLHD